MLKNTKLKLSIAVPTDLITIGEAEEPLSDIAKPPPQGRLSVNLHLQAAAEKRPSTDAFRGLFFLKINTLMHVFSGKHVCEGSLSSRSSPVRATGRLTSHQRDFFTPGMLESLRYLTTRTGCGFQADVTRPHNKA